MELIAAGAFIALTTLFVVVPSLIRKK